MQVTLKKARKIVDELREVVNKLPVSETLILSAYRGYTPDMIEDEINSKQIELNSNFDKTVKVLNWIYEIRNTVAEANQKAGVDHIMTDLKLTEELISRYNNLESVQSRTKFTPAEVIAKMLEAIAKRLDNPGQSSYGRIDDSVSTLVFAEVTDQLKTLKKKKIDLEDQLTALNSAKKITLGDEVSKFLSDEGLI